MTIKLFTASAALALAAACQPVPMTDDSATSHAVNVTPMAQQVASASCSNSIPERDNWLRDERPPVAEVVRSYGERGIDPEESGVFKAYRAYMNAGQDHAAAAAAVGTDYPRLAACFS